MKIIEDKATIYPPHAICKADVPTIFTGVPDSWTEGIQTVRLSAAMQHPRVAYFNPFDGSFTITSRGQTKEQTLRRILTELAAHGLGIQFGLGHRLQKRDVSRIRRVVAPLMKEILPLLSQKKVWLDR